MGLRILPCIITALGILCGRPAAPLAQEAGGDILVLGVTSGQRQDSRLTESLERYLGSTERIISSRTLRAEERKCNEPRCLYALAQRKGASMLIGATLTPTSDNQVELGVYLLLCRSKTWRHAEVAAAPEQLAERLNELTRKLMRGSVVERPRSGLVSNHLRARIDVTDALKQILATPPSERALSATPKRLGISLLVFSSLALGTAALISGFATQYNTPERCFGGFSNTCTDRGTPLSIAGYGAAGGLAIAGVITLAISSRKKEGR